jgi:hypothetical protein
MASHGPGIVVTPEASNVNTLGSVVIPLTCPFASPVPPYRDRFSWSTTDLSNSTWQAFTNGGWFAGAVKRAGVQPITPHDLRHTCASLAVSAGANVLAVARMLGHKDPSVTLRIYADLFDTDLDRVAEALNNLGGQGARREGKDA